MKKILLLSGIVLSGTLCSAQSVTASSVPPRKPFKVTDVVPRSYTGPGNIKRSLGTMKKGDLRTVYFPVVATSPNDLGARERFPFKRSDIMNYRIPEGSGISSVDFDALRGYFSLIFKAGEVGKVDEVVEVSTRNEGIIYLTLSGEVVE